VLQQWYARPRYVPAYIPRRPYIPPSAAPSNTCTITYGTTYQTIDGFGVGIYSFGNFDYDTLNPVLAVEDKALSATTALAGTATLSASDEWACIITTYKCTTAPTLVQEQNIGSQWDGFASITFPAFSSNVTAGNMLYAAFLLFGTVASSGTVTVSDSLGQTWNLDKSQNLATVGYSLWAFSYPNTLGGACTPTITISGTPGGLSGDFREYHGPNTSSALDKSASANSTSTSPSSGNTATLSQATELAVTAVGIAQNVGLNVPSAGSGWSNFNTPSYIWVQTITSGQANQLFSTSAGIGLSIVRVAIKPNSTNGTTAVTGYVSDVKAALTAGASRVVGSVWSPPATWKSNSSFTGGALSSSHYTDFSNYLASYVTWASGQGITIYAISPQNEPDITTSLFTCGYTAAQMDSLFTTLGPILTTTKIAMPEQSGWSFSIASTVWGDSNASYVGLTWAHNYSGTISAPGGPGGANVWATEYSHTNAYDNSMTDGMTCATDWHNLMTTASASAILYHQPWNLNNTDNEGLMSDPGVSSTQPRRYWILGNWAKFIRPNWVRIGESDNGWGLCSAYADPYSTKFAIVAINNTGSSETVAFTLSGFPNSPATVTPNTTDASNNLVAGSAITVTSNSFTATLGANSVTTFTGTFPAVSTVYGPDSGTGSEGSISWSYVPDVPTGAESSISARAGGDSPTGADGGALGNSIAGESGAESDATFAIVFIGDVPTGAESSIDVQAGADSPTGTDGTAFGSSGAGDSGAESDGALALLFIGDTAAGGESAWWQASVFLADLASGSDGAMLLPLDGDFSFDAGGGAPFGLGGGGGSGTTGQLWTKQYDQLIIPLAADAPTGNDGGLAAGASADSGAGSENEQELTVNAEVFTADTAAALEAFLATWFGADVPAGGEGALGAGSGADLGGGVQYALAGDLGGDSGAGSDDQELGLVTNTAIAQADFGTGAEAFLLAPFAGESAYIVDEDPIYVLDGDHGTGADPGGGGFNSIVFTATLRLADSALAGESAFETFVAADRGVELDLGVAGVVNFGYHIYANSGSGPIDYSTIIATITGFTTTTWTSSALSHPGDWKFGVRAFNSSGEEQNLDVFAEIILDSSGNDITNRPAPPNGLRALAMAAGAIRVEWTYTAFLTSSAKKPTGFHVYTGTGGSPSYASPAATVSYSSAIAGMFVANLTGLTGGTTYSIGVRAYNATAEEPNTTFVNVTADATGPAPVVSLTAAAVAG
jgi:glucuronoarabinoxylan endo-1,4-beta-xylanase